MLSDLYSPMPVAEQSLSIFAAEKGYLTDVPLARIVEFETALIDFANSQYSDLLNKINVSGHYDDQVEAQLHQVLREFFATQAF